MPRRPIVVLVLLGSLPLWAGPAAAVAFAGKLYVHSQPPGATISLNGKRQTKKTPAVLDAPVGNVDVELTLDGYENGAATAKVEAGGVQKVHVELKRTLPQAVDRRAVDSHKRLLSVLVESPAECWIVVNGRKLVDETGKPILTPTEIADFPEGRYFLRIVKKGHRDLVLPNYLVSKSARPIQRRLTPGESETLRDGDPPTVAVAGLRPTAEPGRGEEKFTRILRKVGDALAEESTAPTEFHHAGKEFPTFAEIPFEGALLIGGRFSISEEFGCATISSVQPIFLSARGVFYGGVHGRTTSKTATLTARNGYAVAGMDVKAGLRVNSLQLIFMRVAASGLDPRDGYSSEIVGDQTGKCGKPKRLGADGRIVVGFTGRKGASIDSIGLVLAP